jgi:lysophospholipase L1-like esterase
MSLDQRSRMSRAAVARRLILLLALVIGSPLAASPVGAVQPDQDPPPPTSMAAIGDSLTRAADVCCWYGDHPSNSWSTGGAGWDGTLSHYERLRGLNPAITGRNHNVAVSGARMRDGPGQAQRAVAQGVQYVTVLMGANDICTSALETMTDPQTFRDQLRETLQILDAGLSGRARILVASIPDVHQLWALFHEHPVAPYVWDIADICQSLLAPERTQDERDFVRDRNIALNQILREECAAYHRCRYDDDAVFNFPFERAHVSTLDYFHPSLAGQAALAHVTWQASWWP